GASGIVGPVDVPPEPGRATGAAKALGIDPVPSVRSLAEFLAKRERGQIRFFIDFGLLVAGGVPGERGGGIHQPPRSRGSPHDPKTVGTSRHCSPPSCAAGANGSASGLSMPNTSNERTRLYSVPSSCRRRASFTRQRIPSGQGRSSCSSFVMPSLP